MKRSARQFALLLMLLVFTLPMSAAHKGSIGFAFDFIGDGTQANLVIDLATDPVQFLTGGNQLGLSFETLKTNAMGVVNVSGGPGITSFSYSTLLKRITVVLSDPTENGSKYTVTGDLTF